MRLFYRGIRGRFWWLGSIAHWAILHFNIEQFKENEREKARFSMIVVLVFAAIFFPTLIFYTGVWGLVKFWVVPWFVYHFWMSTFTLVHHTDPDIQFSYPEDWNQAVAQLEGTVHCSYPRWVEILCHDINVHIPHHISTAIPSYNLRKVHASLKEKYCKMLNGKIRQPSKYRIILFENLRNSVIMLNLKISIPISTILSLVVKNTVYPRIKF